MKIRVKKLLTPWNALVGLILLTAFILRVYRVNEILAFYYDQGRDALVIWDLIHNGKLFLIGPVTGLKGIFLGPFYYYLIAPLYWLGRGNPVFPAVFLAILSIIALWLLYLLGTKMHSKAAGLIALLLGSFSFYIVLASRWFSNPTPILLTSVLFLFSLWEIINKKNKYWWIVAFGMIGISLHFESASAVFYLPIMLLFMIWQRKNLPGLKTLLLGGLVLLATLLPQIIFDFRHEHILLNNFKQLFIAEKSFKPLTKFILDVRTELYWDVFSNKLFTQYKNYAGAFFLIVFSVLIYFRKNLKRGILPLFAIFILTPLVIILFYRGNYGNVYDYYFSGYYLPFILLFAIGLAEIWKNKSLRFLVSLFFLIFLSINLPLLRGHLDVNVSEAADIKFANQLAAIDWVYKDAKGEEFNVDVYVPPVIPYAYNYLFLWQGTLRCGEDRCGQKEELRELLYTLYEHDPPHPDRIGAWLLRQKGIGRVIYGEKFGGITVERRERL